MRINGKRGILAGSAELITGAKTAVLVNAAGMGCEPHARFKNDNPPTPKYRTTNMNADQKRRLDMLGRVAGFRTRHAADLTAASRLAGLLDTAAAAESEATGGGTDQSSGKGAAKSGTSTKADLYLGLLADLRDIRNTSRTISKTIPGTAEKFQIPASVSQINILTTARAFLQDAGPLEAEFIACEMEADFLKDLEDDIKAYDKAEDVQNDGQGKRTMATRTIEEAIDDGYEAVRDAEPLVRNKYKNNPAVLAEWFAASHVERAPRKEKKEAPVG